MDEISKQPLNRANEEWADFLINVLIPECDSWGWVVEFDSVMDGCCTIFANLHTEEVSMEQLSFFLEEDQFKADGYYKD
jgi:hypothetical protein